MRPRRTLAALLWHLREDHLAWRRRRRQRRRRRRRGRERHTPAQICRAVHWGPVAHLRAVRVVHSRKGGDRGTGMREEAPVLRRAQITKPAGAGAARSGALHRGKRGGGHRGARQRAHGKRTTRRARCQVAACVKALQAKWPLETTCTMYGGQKVGMNELENLGRPFEIDSPNLRPPRLAGVRR